MKKPLIALAFALLTMPALAESFPVKYDSAATTNSTLVRAGNAQIRALVVINTTAVLYFLKFYDKVTAPTCGTDTVVWKVPVPFGASNAGGGVALAIPDGLQFQNGIGFCLTALQADSDTTAAATGITISLGVKQ